MSRVLAHITPETPYGEIESPTDRALQAAAHAAEDLNAAIWRAETIEELRVIRAYVEALIQQLTTSSCVALTLVERFHDMRGTK